MGLVFQVPVGVLALTRTGVVNARILWKNQGYVILGIAVVAAVVTPTPDPVTMLVTMAPLLLLYELSIGLSWIFRPRGDTITQPLGRLVGRRRDAATTTTTTARDEPRRRRRRTAGAEDAPARVS